MTRPRKKSRRKPDSNPGSSALEADALTTRPARRLLECSRAGIAPRCPGWGHSREFGIDTQGATLQDVWHYRVNVLTGWPSVFQLLLFKIASLVFSGYLSVAVTCLSRFVPETHFACCWDV